MPLKNGRLTPQESAFVEAMARTNDPLYAAVQAHYSSPAARASQVMQRPEIIAAIRERVQFLVQTRGAQVAAETLIEISADTSAPKNARVAASKVLAEMNRLGIVEGDGSKALSEMTREELAAARDRAVAYLRELDTPQIEGTAVEISDDGPEPHNQVGGLFD